MRIPIREQLALLVLLTSLLALAVVAIATNALNEQWVTNHNFVVGVRLSSLSLTATLKAAQLTTNLRLLQSSVQATATRVLLQNALSRYDNGNNTDANWVNANADLRNALSSGASGASATLLQARVVSKNGTGLGGPYGLINVTTQQAQDQIQLPYNNANGSSVYLGDPGLGFPPPLYPNLTFSSIVINSTFNESDASFDGYPLNPNSAVFLGPFQINSTFALFSITVPIINNTSSTDVLGWITVVLDGGLLYGVITSPEGLESTGVVLIVGPVYVNNTFPPGVLYSSNPKDSQSAEKAENVQFVLPPLINSSQSTRHSARSYGQPNTPFTMGSFPSVLQAFTQNQHAINNAGSLLSTTNEEGDSVSVGFALPSTKLVDWVLLVEQAHSEVVQPINHLRNVLLACVFGTIGVICLFLYPIAHISVLPIRRLRHATKQTIEPYGQPSDEGSIRSSTSNEDDDFGADAVVSGEDNDLEGQVARKEGFLDQISSWGRKRRKGRAERQEQARRHTFRIPGKVEDRKHIVHDELTDLTETFNEMSEELVMQYERLEERVKERTAELEASKKAAEAANESKTLFIANISHELKTPLNGILGIAAVCMHEEDQTKIKRSLGIIYKSGDLLLHLLTDLLTFSKNQIGQQLSLDEKEFRLADISSQILSIFEKQAREGSIKLRVKFEGPNESLETSSGTPGQAGLGPYGTGRVRDMCLWGDQHRILQVIINLVSNSLKFTPPGGSVEVRIKCLYEVEERRSRASSRKGSTKSKQSKYSKHSRQSKQPKHTFPSRDSSNRGRVHSDSDSSAISPIAKEGVASTYINTKSALEINKKDPITYPQIAVLEQDRSASPAPINARTMVFGFEVEDSGPGIPENQQQKVFEPFVQGDLGLSKKYGGTGLGLSICSQLAGLMRGSITLKSELGCGSTFTMRIPLKFTKERVDSTISLCPDQDSHRNSMNVSINDEPYIPLRNRSSPDISIEKTQDASTTVAGYETPAKPRLVGLSQPFFAASPPLESPTDQLAVMERVTAEVTRTGDKVRVLVAEDNKVNQEVVLRMLKLEDIYDVTVAKDGQEAFELVKESMEQQKLFNLIFMDIQMPNLDGLQSTRLIREMGYSAPIVALTAFSEESNVKECMDSGMDFFLPKPIRRPALKQVLKRYCATIPEAPEDSESPPFTNVISAQTLPATKVPTESIPPADTEAISPMS